MESEAPAPPANSSRRFKVAMIGAKGVPARVGGVEKIVDELGGRLAARGHEVTVYCRREYTGRLPENRYRDMRLLWTPAWPGKYTSTLSHAFTSLGDALFRDYDLLHIHSLGTAPIVPLAWLAGRRVLFHIHGQEWKGGKWGRRSRAYFKACEPVALDFAHGVIVNTMASRDYYQAAYGRTTTYIPNAVEMPGAQETGILRELGLSPRGYLLFVGRLVPEKGCHHLVAAHRALGLELPVVVIGEESHSAAYAALLKARAGPAFHFLGTAFGDRLTELYARSLIVVNPTERDAVSLVLLEAMAQGACVLTSDIPEMKEGLSGCGYHFRAGDPLDLARVLSRLLNDPAAIDAVREKARERVRMTYAWDPVTDQFEALYREVTRGA
jgi:glycosyltransferase involved in cell wall biosynthesis